MSRHTNIHKQWTKFFSKTENGVTVVVHKLDLPRPKYSVQLGVTAINRMNGEEVFRQHIPLNVEGRGKVYVTHVDPGLFQALFEEAQEVVRKDAQEAEDAWVSSKQAREQRDLDRNKPKQQRGIKTLGKVDHAAKQAAGNPMHKEPNIPVEK
jgi:hypothetical protein